MILPAKPSADSKFRFRTPVLVALLSVSMVVLLVFVGVVFSLHSLRVSNQDEEAQLEAAGIPVSLEELNESYAVVPDDENAAVLLWPLLAQLDESKIYEEAMNCTELFAEERIPGTPLKWDDVDSVVPLLDDFESRFLAGFSEALSRDACRYPIDLREGIVGRLPHLAPIRGAGRLLVLCFVRECLKGNYADGIDRLRMALDLAGTLCNEPGVISQLVRAYVVRSCARAIQDMLVTTAIPAPWMGEMKAILCERDYSVCDVRAFQGEIRLILSAAETFLRPSLADPEMQDFARVLDRVPEPLRSFWEGWQRREIYLRLRPILSLFEEPWAEWIARYRYAENVPEGRRRMGEIAGSFFSGALGDSLVIAVSSAEKQAYLRIVSLALELLEFRDVAGSFPRTLDELGAEMTPVDKTDPFDGKPIRYSLQPNGFTVYSIAQDLTDDCGRPLDKSTMKGDISFKFVVPGHVNGLPYTPGRRGIDRAL